LGQSGENSRYRWATSDDAPRSNIRTVLGRQRLDDSAFSDETSALTTVAESPQFGGEPLEIADLVFDVNQMLVCDAVNLGAGLGLLRRQPLDYYPQAVTMALIEKVIEETGYRIRKV
jgi:hypothetical protein